MYFDSQLIEEYIKKNPDEGEFKLFVLLVSLRNLKHKTKN